MSFFSFLRPSSFVPSAPARIDQLFLFIAQELLAVGQARLSFLRRNIGQLRHERPGTVEGKNEEIAVAHVGDVGVVACPAGIRFGAGRARDLTSRSVRAVNQNDVTAVYKERAAVCLVPPGVGRRDRLDLVVREFTRLAAVASDHIRRRLFFARFAPVEIQLLRVGRPAQAGRRVPHEVRSAHDAVDGEIEAGASRYCALGRCQRFLRRGRDERRPCQENYRKCKRVSSHVKRHENAGKTGEWRQTSGD